MIVSIKNDWMNKKKIKIYLLQSLTALHEKMYILLNFWIICEGEEMTTWLISLRKHHCRIQKSFTKVNCCLLKTKYKVFQTFSRQVFPPTLNFTMRHLFKHTFFKFIKVLILNFWKPWCKNITCSVLTLSKSLFFVLCYLLVQK